MPKAPTIMKKRALALTQGSGHRVYLFSLKADEILKVADISRVARTDEGDLIGYQRPEVKRHIDTIVDYLNTADPILPNAIIMALTPEVVFRSSRGPNVSDGLAVSGTLEILLPSPNEPKPGWIVDGQQRTVALSKAKDRAYAVPVTAFVSDTIDLQRDQFLRINNTHPLPRGLVTELLPQISTPISPRLSARKLPAALVDQLNRDKTSPFHGLIRRASDAAGPRRAAVITDTSLLLALEESLNTPSGCLFSYRNITTGETDIEGIWVLLLCYWSAVRDTFPSEWARPSTQSRLTHGVGIRAMGRLMDRVMSSVKATDANAPGRVRADLRLVAPYCRWTEGQWEGLGGAKWNDLQNVSRHIQMLSNYLIRLYVQLRTET
jgi:DGQHR domain-containing protein